MKVTIAKGFYGNDAAMLGYVVRGGGVDRIN